MKTLHALALSLALLPACATSVVGLSRDASTADTAADSAQDTAPESAPNCDQDGDGFLSLACGGNDCDDTRASVNPGRSAADDTGTCDGLDNDCNPRHQRARHALRGRRLLCAGRGVRSGIDAPATRGRTQLCLRATHKRDGALLGR